MFFFRGESLFFFLGGGTPFKKKRKGEESKGGTSCLTEDAAGEAGEDPQARAEQADDPVLFGFLMKKRNHRGEE